MPYPAKTSPDAIRGAAFDLLEREGAGALSVRGVAAALGLAPTALYHHFAGRGALLAAVADEASRRVHAAVLRALRRRPEAAALGGAAGTRAAAEARAGARAFADAYLAFARRHPAVYDVLNMRHETLERDDREPAAHDALWATLVELLTPLAGAAAPAAGVAFWGLLHGTLGLERAGLLGGKKPHDAVDLGVEAFLAGLPHAAAPSAHPTGPPTAS